jgi:hypothetical protein
MRDIFLENKVENETEAYILGFLYADGTIIRNGKKNKKTYKTINITLAEKDKEILFDINKFLKGNIKYYNSKLGEKLFSQIRLSVYDIALAKRLINLGISPNKTYDKTSFVFDNVPENLKYSFIRGFFDGDGSVSQWFEVCSLNDVLLKSMLEFIKKDIFTSSKITNGDGVKRIRIGGIYKMKQLYNLLYEDASLYLKRKEEKFRVFTEIEKAKASQYKYIRWIKQRKCWQTRIKEKSRNFKTEYDAFLFYNEWAFKNNKEQQIWRGNTKNE